MELFSEHRAKRIHQLIEALRAEAMSPQDVSALQRIGSRMTRVRPPRPDFEETKLRTHAALNERGGGNVRSELRRQINTPHNHGQAWYGKDDGTLSELFRQGAGLEDMGLLLGRTELAIRYRLMHLGLRDDWELREFDKKHGRTTPSPLISTPPYRRFGSGEGKLYHAHEHMHFDVRRFGSPPLAHEHIHQLDHHIGHTKDEKFATMYGAGPRTLKRMRDALDERHHVHRHEHGKLNRVPTNHTHKHMCGHHHGEKNVHGAIVTSRYTGPLMKYRPGDEVTNPWLPKRELESTRRRRLQEDNEFRIMYECKPPEERPLHEAKTLRFAAAYNAGPEVMGTVTGRLISNIPFHEAADRLHKANKLSFSSRPLRRYTVYFIDNFSDRTKAEGPKHIIGRRDIAPGATIGTAFRRLNSMRIVINDDITLFLVDVGEDKGFGQMIDVKLSVINVNAREWTLTPFTML